MHYIFYSEIDEKPVTVPIKLDRTQLNPLLFNVFDGYIVWRITVHFLNFV